MTLRRLALPAVLSLGLLPGLAQALGLGEIKLNSDLYEPLDAEIELVSVRDLETREILPSLAGSSEFQKAGVERFFHLSKMRFKIEERAGGKKVIRVTTTDVVTEPFLNFVVEVHWPSGRLLREYTMLLDPPAFARATPAPIAPPVARKELPPVTPKMTKAPEPAPTRTAVRAPVTTASTTGTVSAEKKTDPLKKSPEPEQAAPAATNVSGDATYGPVKANDTLWKIAQRYRPSGANMHQTMLAIQRLNPDAFINNNINLLKRGKVLKIPAADQVADLSRSQATEEIARQEEEWKGKKREPVRQVSRDVESSDSAASDDSAHLKLVSAPTQEDMISGTSAGGTEDGTGAADDALAVSKELLDTSERRAGELEGHVSQLEDQVKTLERLIELKNAQLADLQSKLDVADAGSEEAPGDPMAAMDKALAESNASADESADDGSMTLEERLAAAQAALDDAGDEMGEVAAEAEDTLAGLGDSATDLGAEAADAIAEPAVDLLSDPAAEEAAPVADAKPEPKPEPKPAPKPKQIKPTPPPPEPGLFENPMVLGGIGGGILMALVGAFMFLRRRAAGADEEEELAILQEDDMLESGDNSMIAGLDDVADEPEAAAEDLTASMDAALEEMPAEAPEPESMPPATAVEQAAGEEDDGPSLDDLGMELTADIAGGTADDAAEEELAAELESLSAELDSELDEGAEAPIEEPPQPATAIESAGLDDLDDLDLDDLDLDSLPDDDTADSVLADLELDLDDDIAEEAAATVGELDDDLGSLDLDAEAESLDDLDLSAGAAETEAADDMDLSSGAVDDLDLTSDLETDLGDLEAELGDLEAAAEPVEPAGEAESLDDLDLGDLDLDDTAGGDEVATKMDLARAYVDMGDEEGAREILDEVVQEGNDEQKAEAQALIAKL